MASIARKNLFEDIPRFLVAQAGIVFAVSLIAIQTGVLKGFTRSTTLLIEDSEADLWVASEEWEQFELTQPMPLDRVNQIQKIEGVQRAEPLLLQSGRWESAAGNITSVRLFGFQPEGRLFQPGELVAGRINEVDQPYSILVDKTSLKKLGLQQVGDQASINATAAKLVGITSKTQSIASSAFAFTSLENVNAFVTSGLTSSVRCDVQPDSSLNCTTVYERSPDAEPQPPRALRQTDLITYVLVKAKPNQNIETLRSRLESSLSETRVFTTDELAAQTRQYWQQRTGVGFILGLGATVGAIVGVVIVGQILYSSVSDHIKEFGTLKAMGAPDRAIYGIIIEQALWMAVLGYIPSMALCYGLGAWTFATQGIMILITPSMAAGIFGITIAMCIGSALFAIQKVTRVDPAIVFKA